METEMGIVQAKGRGLFKKDGFLLMVGDRVELDYKEGDDSIITSVEERKNSCSRPPIANVDKLIVVMAMEKPAPNLQVTDKLLAMAEAKGVDPVVCINKCDSGNRDKGEELADIYRDIYPTVLVSGLTGENIDKLLKLIEGGNAAMAGPSGVGKSTLTNRLIPHASMEVGDISSKTDRGKHTTRHVEMFKLGEGYLFDTPGFTSLYADEAWEDDLGGLFPEIRENRESCRFDDCRHVAEPDCGVIKALEEGRIKKTRYESYISIMNEMSEKKKY